ncbi:TetR/AcrR family transcriptional regulator [Thermodesulfobacteriota bacterium]
MKANDKHEKILEAAVKVFASKGFYNAKVAEIAREAGIADGTIYLYFKNKDDILISLFEEKINKIILRMQAEIQKIENPVEKLRKFITMHLKLVREDRHLAEVIQVELRQSNKFMREYNPVKFLDYMNIISSVVKEGQQRNVFRKEVSPGIVKRALFGALDEMALHFVLVKGSRYDIEKTADQIADIFILGLTDGKNGDKRGKKVNPNP